MALVIALSGCAAARPGLPLTTLPHAEREGEGKAVFLAWSLLGQHTLPPVIHWVEKRALNCEGEGGHHGWKDPRFPGECVYGLTDTPYNVKVAWWPGDTFSGSSMVHELLHVAYLRQTGDARPKHGPEWEQGGTVDQINQILMSEGL